MSHEFFRMPGQTAFDAAAVKHGYARSHYVAMLPIHYRAQLTWPWSKRSVADLLPRLELQKHDTVVIFAFFRERWIAPSGAKSRKQDPAKPRPTPWVGGTHRIALATTNTGKGRRHLERMYLNFLLRGRSPSREPATSSVALN
jgi:hypothetical protein